MVSQVVCNDVVSSFIQSFVIRQEVDLEATESSISFDMSREAVSIACHRMIGDDEFLRAGLRDVPALQDGTVQGREEYVLVLQIVLAGATENGTPLRIFEKQCVLLDEIIDRFVGFVVAKCVLGRGRCRCTHA